MSTGGTRDELGHLQHFPDIPRAIQELAGPRGPGSVSLHGVVGGGGGGQTDQQHSSSPSPFNPQGLSTLCCGWPGIVLGDQGSQEYLQPDSGWNNSVGEVWGA